MLLDIYIYSNIYRQKLFFWVSQIHLKIIEYKRVQKYRKHKTGHDNHSNGVESSQKFFTLFCLVSNTEYEKHEIFHKRDSLNTKNKI